MARKSNTRGAQGAGTIRQRKDGRWEARYTVGRDPGTGKQIQRSVYGATQQEVRKKLAQLTTAIDSGTYKEPCKMTVGQWLDIWMANYMGGVKPSTQIPIVLGYRMASLFPGQKARRNAELLGLMVREPHIPPGELERLTMPALVIAGTRDMIRPAP